MSSQRLGQKLFNILHDLDPEQANYVRGTEHDPFYNDEIIPRFFRVLVNDYVNDRESIG